MKSMRIHASSLGGVLAVTSLFALPTDASSVRTRDGGASVVSSHQVAAPNAGTYMVRSFNGNSRGQVNVFGQDGTNHGTLQADASGSFQLVAVPGSIVILSQELTMTGLPGADAVKLVIPETTFGELVADFSRPVPEDGSGQEDVGGATPCAATVVPSLPFLDAGTTVGQGTSTGIPACGNLAAPDVFYRWTPTVSGNLTATFCSGGGSASYDSWISIYKECVGCTPGPQSLLCLSNNDDFCGLSSQTAVTTTAGQTYIIRVHGFGGSSGAYTLSLTNTGSGPNTACPLITGACCLTGPGAPLNCIITDAATCTGAGGTYAGNNLPCSTGTALEKFATAVPSPGFGGPPFGTSPSNSVTVTFVAPTECCAITDMDALIHLHHNFVGDLQLDITSPTGTLVRVWGGPCGIGPNVHFIADDTGINPAATLCTSVFAEPAGAQAFSNPAWFRVDSNGPPPIFGATPNGMEGFEGQNTCLGAASGTWTHLATDTFPGSGGGTIQGFGLAAGGCVNPTFTCVAAPCSSGPTSAASSN